MPICEVCGTVIRGKPVTVEIEGAILQVCQSCAKRGEPVKVLTRPALKPKSFLPLATKKASSKPFTDESFMLRKDYNVVIKRAREKLGMSQEELGKKIGEKPSVISLLETGRLKPSDSLARKLEHALKVDLFELVEE
jgi:putative transcription factor